MSLLQLAGGSNTREAVDTAPHGASTASGVSRHPVRTQRCTSHPRGGCVEICPSNQEFGPSKGVHMSSERLVHDDRATIPKTRCKVGVAVTAQTKHTYGAPIMWRNSPLRPHRLAHAPTRLPLALIAGAAI